MNFTYNYDYFSCLAVIIIIIISFYFLLVLVIVRSNFWASTNNSAWRACFQVLCLAGCCPSVH